MQVTAKQAISGILFGALCLALVIPGVALAERGSVVIDGPGFKVENKKGWFGRSEKTYKDAFGNTYVKKRGWFGREKTQQSLFGSQVVQNGKNMTVLGPNGKPLVEKKKSWLGGEQTHIDGTGIIENVKELLQQTP